MIGGAVNIDTDFVIHAGGLDGFHDIDHAATAGGEDHCIRFGGQNGCDVGNQIGLTGLPLGFADQLHVRFTGLEVSPGRIGNCVPVFIIVSGNPVFDVRFGGQRHPTGFASHGGILAG